jgi:hypothetical protein
MPVLATMAAGDGRKPKVRMQSADEPVAGPSASPVAGEARRLVLPSPEALGIGLATKSTPSAETDSSAAVDWNDAHARLKRLGAIGFHLERDPQGHRVTFLLPAGQEKRTQHIEVVAASEALALATALERAEAWAEQRR